MDSILIDPQQLINFSLLPVLSERIRAIMRAQRYTKGVCLLQPGQSDTDLHYIVNGVVRGFNHELDKEKIRDVTLWLASANDLANDVNIFFLNQPSAIYVEALEPTVVVALPKKELNNLFIEHPEMNEIGQKLLQRHTVNTDRRVQILQTRNAHKRIELFNTYYPSLANRIPQKHIASFLNIHPVTLSRIRGERG